MRRKAEQTPASGIGLPGLPLHDPAEKPDRFLRVPRSIRRFARTRINRSLSGFSARAFLRMLMASSSGSRREIPNRYAEAIGRRFAVDDRRLLLESVPCHWPRWRSAASSDRVGSAFFRISMDGLVLGIGFEPGVEPRQ